ncbi:MAG: hypothetical protein KatS3mg109_1337 [Pirellulaceae bacterium]|nr:MAG: hypothetical protein KatS3mg109_0395 [Pirellulaceae bacterium]GIW90767.1 MAG: hypothetical protein KatS3mg109_1199 [Pirellulaceae bacterium]GIW90905.1 MAG: hypothetical protein KatS3mg109_1337 [Pirellulaceae bacterium]
MIDWKSFAIGFLAAYALSAILVALMVIYDVLLYRRRDRNCTCERILSDEENRALLREIFGDDARGAGRR